MNNKNKKKLIISAQKYFRQNKIELAIEEYIKILNIDSNDIESRKILGELFIKKGDKRTAISHFVKVANLYKTEGFDIKAIAMLKRILKIDENNDTISMKLGQLYVDGGLYADAKELYLDAAKKWEVQKNQAKAVDMYKKILEFEKQNSTITKLLEKYSNNTKANDDELVVESGGEEFIIDNPEEKKQSVQNKESDIVILKNDIVDKKNDKDELIIESGGEEFIIDNPEEKKQSVQNKEPDIVILKNDIVDKKNDKDELIIESGGEKFIIDNPENKSKTTRNKKPEINVLKDDDIKANGIEEEFEIEDDGEDFAIDNNKNKVSTINSSINIPEYRGEAESFNELVDFDNLSDTLEPLESPILDTVADYDPFNRGFKYYDLSKIAILENNGIMLWMKELDRQNTSTIETNMKEIFKAFSEQVDRKIGFDDFETRYNLGIAYMEMGLFDEAINEFLISSKDKSKEGDIAGLIGICFRKKGMYNESLTWFSKALQIAENNNKDTVSIRYELILDYQELNDQKNARKFAGEIMLLNPYYRDIRKIFKSINET